MASFIACSTRADSWRNVFPTLCYSDLTSGGAGVHWRLECTVHCISQPIQCFCELYHFITIIFCLFFVLIGRIHARYRRPQSLAPRSLEEIHPSSLHQSQLPVRDWGDLCQWYREVLLPPRAQLSPRQPCQGQTGLEVVDSEFGNLQEYVPAYLLICISRISWRYLASKVTWEAYEVHFNSFLVGCIVINHDKLIFSCPHHLLVPPCFLLEISRHWFACWHPQLPQSLLLPLPHRLHHHRPAFQSLSAHSP